MPEMTSIFAPFVIFLSIFLENLYGYKFSSFRKTQREVHWLKVPFTLRERTASLLRGSLSVNQVEGVVEAFIGGTVGIMGTMIALEMKTKEDAGLEACPYCMGFGEIVCASCCGTGAVNSESCQTCGQSGAVLCINCKGDGRMVPLILQNQNSRSPDSAYSSTLLKGTSTIDNP